MTDFQPGQLVRFSQSSIFQGAARFFVNGSFVHGAMNLYEDPLIVISYPPKCPLPKYSTSPESWCEVMDSQGRVGALYPSKYLEVIQ